MTRNFFNLGHRNLDLHFLSEILLQYMNHVTEIVSVSTYYSPIIVYDTNKNIFLENTNAEGLIIMLQFLLFTLYPVVKIVVQKSQHNFRFDRRKTDRVSSA